MFAHRPHEGDHVLHGNGGVQHRHLDLLALSRAVPPVQGRQDPERCEHGATDVPEWPGNTHPRSLLSDTARLVRQSEASGP